MKFKTKIVDSEDDWNEFFNLSFQTAKVNNDIIYRQLVSDNPDADEEELMSKWRKECEEYSGFTDPTSRVHALKNGNGEYIGHIWLALRNSEDFWDFQRPLWIYDIIVKPSYRGKGLGKMLLREADTYAEELSRNIGLFVHEHNKAAIGLYESNGYSVKCIPMSREVPVSYSRKDIEDIIVREATIDDIEKINSIGLASFRRMVSFSMDSSISGVEKKYSEYASNYESSEREKSTLIALKDSEIVGFIRFGISTFSAEISSVYDYGISYPELSSEVSRVLIPEFIEWSIVKDLSRCYYLLHTLDDLSSKQLQTFEFKIPGFFMEKRIE